MLKVNASRNGLTLHNLRGDGVCVCVWVCVGEASLCIPGM